MQTFTSSATSINRSKLPAVYGKAKLSRTTPFLVDYGCGKYTDHIESALREPPHARLHPLGDGQAGRG